MAGHRSPSYGIGVDIEKVERFRNEKSSRLIRKVFTDRETAYCMSKTNPSMHFAGMFAAKEATVKALRLRAGTFSLGDLEVCHGEEGVPLVRYKGTNAELRDVEVVVSVSHTEENAVAVALSTGRGKSSSHRGKFQNAPNASVGS